MAGEPLTIKLRCNSWGQLATMYKRDLARSALFLKAKKPPPIGTKIRVSLALPSETTVVLAGSVARHIPPGGLDGRGPGVDVQLHSISQTTMWLIESALASAKGKTTSALHKLPTGAARQATRQGRAPPTVAPSAAQTREDVSLEDGSHLVEAEGDLVGALQEELESLRRLNPFQVLDVPYRTDDDTVRAAFARLTKRYHPDRFAKYQSAEARECASEIFILIRDAYRKVGNESARRQTLLALRKQAASARAKAARTSEAAPHAGSARAPSPPSTSRTPIELPLQAPKEPPRVAQPARRPAPPAGLSPQPEARPSAAASQPGSPADEWVRPTSYKRAETLISEGNYAEALAIYKISVRKHPEDTLSRAGMELCHGLKALAERDRLEAAQRFEAVLELDPTNERAARELAEMRRQATADRKGLLARLLGKKE